MSYIPARLGQSGGLRIATTTMQPRSCVAWYPGWLGSIVVHSVGFDGSSNAPPNFDPQPTAVLQCVWQCFTQLHVCFFQFCCQQPGAEELLQSQKHDHHHPPASKAPGSSQDVLIPEKNRQAKHPKPTGVLRQGCIVGVVEGRANAAPKPNRPVRVQIPRTE